jgi:diguanylate cyclase (GGDEF)-like protein
MYVASGTSIPQLGVSSDRPVFRSAAIGLAAASLAIALVAGIWGNRPGPHLLVFVPISATLSATVELLTAFLLFSQFYVAGRLSIAAIASAYAFVGLITIPYLIMFPGLVPTDTASLAILQISAYLWAAAHLAFPLVVSIAHLMDPELTGLVVVRRNIVKAVRWFIVALGAGTLATVYAIFRSDSSLPTLVLANGHFTAPFAHVVAPVVVAANLIGCGIVALSFRKPTPLQTWLAVALFASALDGALSAVSGSRYSLSWYAGTAGSVVAASAVLCVLLYEISTLYRRLVDAASIDPLTGLHNRRTLGSDLGELLLQQRTAARGIAMLLIDIDHFKAVNDTYGHSAGDQVLRCVADIIRTTARRPGDMSARYGGEEFVSVLPNTSLAGARVMGERMRAAIATRTTVVDGGHRIRVTASIGIAYADSVGELVASDLFEIADRALYVAKDHGRNCIVALDANSDPETWAESAAVFA